MSKTVYIETSIISYLTSQPSRDLRAAAWQQITSQWWQQERAKYELYTSALVVREASQGDAAAAGKRLEVLAGMLMEGGGVPPGSEGDALHIAVAAAHEMDYLLTWNCRHIDNAVTKPIIRSICATAGYACPEICTPLELLWEEPSDV
jgi:hypothetical protein